MGDNETPVSPVTTSKPELTISEAAINEGAAAELDSTPVSPEQVRNSRRGSRDELSPEEKARRAQLHAERENDPAVLVDIDASIPGSGEAEIASKQTDRDDTTTR